MDNTDRYKSGLALLGALNPELLELELANVAPAIATVTMAYSPYAVMDYGDILKNIQDSSRQILEDALDEACKQRLKAITISLDGNPSQCLSEEAERIHADLIVTSAGCHGAVHRLLAGSATYSLACTSKTSLLIARCPEKFQPPVRAVFATDHSAYAERALKRFLSWNLHGLTHLTVLSAYATEGEQQAYINRMAAISSEDVEQFVYRKIKRDTDAIATELHELGIPTESRVVNERAQEAIHNTMMDTKADLLILGAKGHTMWDRLLLGSTALHQVVAEPYSVLIVRP